MSERYSNKLAVIINSAMRFSCALIIMVQSAVVLSAGDSGPEAESTDYINLLKNGGFEIAKEGEENPADWSYYGGSVSGEWELTKRGHGGKQCVRLWSDNPGYHVGPSQSVMLEGNRGYKLSAWVKADLSKGGKVVLLCYDGGRIAFAQDGQKTNKYWSGSAGEKKESFDWQYVEKTLEMPADVVRPFNVNMFPVLFHGQGVVWVDDVRLVDLGPAKLGKEIYSMSFGDPKPWKLSAHVNEALTELPEGVGIQSDAKHICDGKPGLRLNYVFPSAKHDAVMLTTDVSLSGGTLFTLRVCGDGSGQELFAVLFDKSSEAHYLPIGPVYWRGWKTVYKSIADLCKGPASKWDVSCKHWGGDKNQTLDFPITRISIGLNDQPDSFKGKGEITFGWMKVYE